MIVIDVPLRGQLAALVDSGILAVGSIVKVQGSLHRELEIPLAFCKIPPVFLIGRDLGNQLLAIQIVGQIDNILQAVSIFAVFQRGNKFGLFLRGHTLNPVGKVV